MTGLILFSHGSLLCGSSETLNEHAERIRTLGLFGSVEVGFMNYSSPTFADAVQRTIDAGATKIVVAPYFLVPGKFVRVDLPRHVATARTKFPMVKFVVAESLGYDARLADVLLELGRDGQTSEQWNHFAESAAVHCSNRSDCPLRSTHFCRMSDLAAPNEVSPNRPTVHQAEQKLAILVMVHGSPRETANKPMFEVVEVLKETKVIPIVEVGFMECNEPDIPTAIANCIRQGATEITAVPYFLHTGNHVANDLPQLLREAEVANPEVTFKMSNYLGTSEKLTAILIDRARNANLHSLVVE